VISAFTLTGRGPLQAFKTPEPLNKSAVNS